MKHDLPEHPVFRPGTVDLDIWREAVVKNVYGLPDLFRHKDVVIDIGAHTGSVTWRCAASGARVIAVEPSRENYHLLMHNLRPVWNQVLMVNAAAWRSDRPACELSFDANWQPCNTGGGCVLGDDGSGGHGVLAVPLDDLLRLQPRVRLLKLDCEGSEFPCLYTATLLGRVAEIVGEYHERGQVEPYADCGQPYTIAALSAYLEGLGFEVRVDRKGPGMGLFRATRPAA